MTVTRRTVLAGGLVLVGCSKRTDPVVELLKVPRTDALRHVGKRLRAGLKVRDAWVEVLRAALRFQGEVHSRLATLSMRQMAGGDDPLALMWAVDALKLGQTAAGTPSAPRAVPINLRRASVEHLRKRLDEAFDALDPFGCSICLRALFEASGKAEAAEALYRMAAREDGAGGHGTMYAVQAVRALDLAGWRDAQVALDQAARRMMPPGSRQHEPDAAACDLYKAHRARSAQPWKVGARRGEARSVLDAARTGTRASLSAGVGMLLARGESPASVWDGLRLAAAEFAVSGEVQRLGVHAFDTLNALRVASARSSRPATRQLLVLQAAERLPGLRPVTRRPLRIDEAKPRKVDRAKVVARVLQKAGADWHAVKYPAAVLEEAAASSADVGARLLGAIDATLPKPDAPDWSRLADARAALA